jgi:hypothetical protein
VPKESKYHLGVEIDKLTNSIVNAFSGDSFPTDVRILIKADLKNVTKQNKWQFNWAAEYKLKDRAVYKLTIRNNPEIIQGLVSISDYLDHYYLHLIVVRAKCMKVWREICLLLPVRSLGIKVTRDLYPLLQRHD